MSFCEFLSGYQNESWGDEIGRGARHELLGYFTETDTDISRLSFACILLTATCMTMYELTQSIQSHALNKYILLEHFVTFLLAISPLTTSYQFT